LINRGWKGRQATVDLETIVTSLNLKVFSGFDKLKTKVLDGYTGDLLSDVMANSKEGDLWMTRQVHQNIIAVASLKDHAGIIMVQGAEPAKDTLEKAKKENIPMMGTDLSGFEIAGKIYNLIKEKQEINIIDP
jgi:predicted transcriptional regulator